MSEKNWSSAYLKNSRITMWNDDYLEFLIEKVWKINKPVNLIDFGCGIGFLAGVLLPLLPKGSTYTGIDINKTLLNEASNIFKDSPYQTTFIEMDLLKYEPIKKYDIAICQTVLQHIPGAKNIIKKMKDCVISGGRVICIEIDTITALSAQNFHGINHSEICNLRNYERMIEKATEDKKSDGNIGMKVPAYMQELELRDIDIRINDYVQFINHMGDKKKHEKDIESYMANPWTSKPEDRESSISWFINKGFTEEVAEEQYNCQLALFNYIDKNMYNSFIVNARCLFISYGTV